MAIPENLIPKNVSVESVSSTVPETLPINGVPSNLLPLNTSEIRESLDSLAGQVPTVDTPEIPEFSVLNTVLPNSLFTTGSIDQIRTTTLNTAETYVNGLPSPRTLPVIPSVTVPFPPKRPSFGQIKNYIETKIDRIKLQRQKASTKALDEKLKQRENPFQYRQSLINKQQNVVTGRFKNQ